MTVSAVYANAPLALAVVEIRHPEVAADLTRGEIAGIGQHLTSISPIQVAEEQSEFEMIMGPNGPMPTKNRVRQVAKFLARNRRTSISFGASAISVETTDYRGWDVLRTWIESAIRARQDVAPLVGFERVGLRYIDEIRVPHPIGRPDWTPWVSPELLAPALNDDSHSLTVVQQQCAVQYELDEPGQSVSLRYGAIDGPPSVTGSASLVRAELPAPGPFFLVDIDAAWSLLPGDELPELDAAAVLHRADALHSPIKGLFESLITQRLREDVLQG